MPVHFSWDISFGQIVLTVPLGWLVLQSFRVYQMLLNFRIEHEMLMRDWADRQQPRVRLETLPTRQTKWW
jgi:hypothetical protein